MTVQSLGGSPLDPPLLQFASSRDHHESKKPMLVLFTDDGRRGASLPTAGFPGGSPPPRHGSLGAAIPSPLGSSTQVGSFRSKAPSPAGGRGRLFSGLVHAGVRLPDINLNFACPDECGAWGCEVVTSWWLCLGWCRL